MQLNTANKRIIGLLNECLVVFENEIELNAAIAYKNILNVLMVDNKT